MKSSLTILFSSAGRRVELLNCFRADARELGVALRVVAVDWDPDLSAACRLADMRYAVPRCTEAAFIPRLLEICGAEKVDLVIPTIDTELLPLAAARGRFEAIGARVAIADLETVAMARNKLRTAAFLRQHGIPAPRSMLLEDLLAQPEALQFPVILKPINGSSSIGLRLAARHEEMQNMELDGSAYLAQENWTGTEYTVNMFFDEAGNCRAAVPHRRCEVRAGEVSKGVTERQPQLVDFATRLGRALPGGRGAVCFQSIVTAEGDAMVFELNARFGGGYPLAHRAGARFSRWLLEEAAGVASSAHDEWQEGLAMLRYDAAVFVPPGP